jgi:hypothetical protein
LSSLVSGELGNLFEHSGAITALSGRFLQRCESPLYKNYENFLEVVFFFFSTDRIVYQIAGIIQPRWLCDQKQFSVRQKRSLSGNATAFSPRRRNNVIASPNVGSRK